MTDAEIKAAAFRLGWTVHKDRSIWLWELGDMSFRIPADPDKGKYGYNEEPVIPETVRGHVLEMYADGTLPGDTPICSCGTTENLSYGLDPYRYEILGDYTDCWQCEACLEESRLAI